jgi:hypothetical protein
MFTRKQVYKDHLEHVGSPGLGMIQQDGAEWAKPLQ